MEVRKGDAGPLQGADQDVTAGLLSTPATRPARSWSFRADLSGWDSEALVDARPQEKGERRLAERAASVASPRR